jgi:hypothetical protein
MSGLTGTRMAYLQELFLIEGAAAVYVHFITYHGHFSLGARPTLKRTTLHNSFTASCESRHLVCVCVCL